MPSRRRIATPGHGITRRICPPAPRARMARGGQRLRANCVQVEAESGYRSRGARIAAARVPGRPGPCVEEGSGAILPRPEKVTGTERPA